jgi:PadR family transcriptional regulator, regulatory protein PadR
MRTPSPQTRAVLRHLATTPACGIELMRRCQLGAGTVYPILHRLSSRGFIDGVRVPDGRACRPRVFYRLTVTGRQLVDSLTGDMPAGGRAHVRTDNAA